MTTPPPPNMPSLRAMPLTSVLDAAFHLYRTNLRMFFRPLLLCVIVIACIQLAFNSNNNLPLDWNNISPMRTRTLFRQLQLFMVIGPTAISGRTGHIILDVALSLIWYTALSNSLIAFVADRYLHAHGTDVYATGATLLQPRVASKVIGLVLACTMVFVVHLTSGVWAMEAKLLVVLLASSSDSMSLGLVFRDIVWYQTPWVLGALLCLALIARLLLTSQIIVLENAALPHALWRSWQLTRRAWSRMVLAALVISVLLGLIMAVPTTMVDMIAFMMPENSNRPFTLIQVMEVVADLGELFMFPWILIVFTLLYYDQRIRHEGFDLDVARRQRLDAELEPSLQRGRERWKQRDYAGALQDFDAALRLAPNNIPALHLRTALKLHNKDFAGALADAEHWVTVSPRDYIALEHRGYSRLKLSDTHGAQQDFDAARRIAPDRIRWLQQRATMKRESQDVAGAMQDLEQILHQSPNNDWAHYNIACINAQLGRTDEVFTHLARAIPQNQDWWLIRAQDDTDFDMIRTDPRFVALLDTAQKSAHMKS